MYLEWWMILIFIVVAGIWAEYRHRTGLSKGVTVGVRESFDAAAEDALKEVEYKLIMERLLGAHACIVNFIKWKLIAVDPQTCTFIGYNGNRYAISSELTKELQTVSDKIQEEQTNEN